MASWVVPVLASVAAVVDFLCFGYFPRFLIAIFLSLSPRRSNAARFFINSSSSHSFFPPHSAEMFTAHMYSAVDPFILLFSLPTALKIFQFLHLQILAYAFTTLFCRLKDTSFIIKININNTQPKTGPITHSTTSTLVTLWYPK